MRQTTFTASSGVLGLQRSINNAKASKEKKESVGANSLVELLLSEETLAFHAVIPFG